MSVFLLCWAPFFTIYLVRGVCRTCIQSETLIKLFFYLGYSNSLFNPLLYPLLHRDFRKALLSLVRRLYGRVHPAALRPFAAADEKARRSIVRDVEGNPRKSLRLVRASRKVRVDSVESEQTAAGLSARPRSNTFSPPASPAAFLNARPFHNFQFMNIQYYFMRYRNYYTFRMCRCRRSSRRSGRAAQWRG